MSLPFNQFLRQIVGGGSDGVPNLPPSSQSTTARTPMIGPMPTAGYIPPRAAPVQQNIMPQFQGPMPTPGYVAPLQPQPIYQTPQVQQQAMSPAQFAAQQQGPYQGPAASEADPIELAVDRDYTGTWVTVQYADPSGINYILLMPKENAADLPSGATLIGGEINNPEQVQSAYEAGEKGQQGQGFVGALDQAPPEIQGIFRDESDQAAIDQGNQELRHEKAEDNIQAIEDIGFTGPVQPTTTVPRFNEQGQDASMIQQDQAAFDQFMADVNNTTATKEVERTGTDPLTITDPQAAIRRAMVRKPSEIDPTLPQFTQPLQPNVPDLTAEQLRQTDEQKAALLESQGIFSVPVDQMVVQYADGRLSRVPVNDVPPPNSVIITYGGNMPNPSDEIGEGWLFGKKVGDPGDWLMGMMDAANGVLEAPKRESQNLFTDVMQSGPVEWWRNTIFDPTRDIFNKTPLGMLMGQFTNDQSLGDIVEMGGYGYPAYGAWLSSNEDVARQVHENGYTAPNGEQFYGNRAVWEYWQSTRSLSQRMLDDMTTDPLNYAPSMGAPARGAAETIGNVRRGIGYTDEAIDVVNGADNVFDTITPARRTAEEILTTADEVPTSPNMTAAEQAAQQNPITGRGIVEDVVDVTNPGVVDSIIPSSTTPVQPPPQSAVNQPGILNEVVDIGTSPPVVDTIIPAARRPGVRENALEASETALRIVADVLDIPENILGEMVDAGVVTLSKLGQVFGNVPLGDGRKLSDVFATTDQSVIRNTEEEISTTFDDTRALPRTEVADTVIPEFDGGRTRAATEAAGVMPEFEASRRVRLPGTDEVVTVPTGTAPETPTTLDPAAQVEDVLLNVPTTTGQQPLAATGDPLVVDQDVRNIDAASQSVDGASTPLAVDRSVRDLDESTGYVLVKIPTTTVDSRGIRRARRGSSMNATGSPTVERRPIGYKPKRGEVIVDTIMPESASPVMSESALPDTPIDVPPVQRQAGLEEQSPTVRPANEPISLNPEQQARIAREEDFRATPVGKQTEQTVSQWPEYLRPQTSDARRAGEGRLGSDFDLRPQDAARAMASELPEKWRAFMRSVDAPMKKLGAADAKRKATTYAGIKSVRQGRELATGFDVKRAVEVLQEAKHYTETVGPKFLQQFREDAELPPWQWKRWTETDGTQHTFLDYLNSSEPGAQITLPEMIEGAIFGPQESRQMWLNEVEKILGRVDDNGVIVRTQRGDAFYRNNLPPELNGAFAQIKKYAREYQKLMDESEKLGKRFTDRLTIEDLRSLSRQANELSDAELRRRDPRGAAIFDRDLAESAARDARLADEEAIFEQDYQRSIQRDAAELDPLGARIYDLQDTGNALRDVADDAAIRALPMRSQQTVSEIDAIPLFDSQGRRVGELNRVADALDSLVRESPNVPMLPYRATSTIDAMPMGAGRAADTAPVGGQPVPPSAIQRQAARRVDDLDNTQIDDLQAFWDYRTRAKRDLDLDPLTRSERRANNRKEYLNSTARGRAEAMKNTTTPMSREDLESFYVRGRAVSASQAEVFGRKFNDGDTLAARWDKYTQDEMKKLGDGATLDVAENLAASRVINDYMVEIMPDDMRALYTTEFQKALKTKVENDEGEMVNRTGLQAQDYAMDRIRRQNRSGKTAGFWRRYDAVMSAIRQTFLYNWLTGPRYIATQMVGNTITAGVTKHNEIIAQTMGPEAIAKAYRAANNEGMLPVSLMDEAMEGYGLGGNRVLTRGDSRVRDQTIEDASSAKKGNSLIGRYTAPIADKRIRDMAAAFDRLPREALWTSMMDEGLGVARTNLWDQMVATMPADASYAQARLAFDALPQRFSQSDYRDAFSAFDAKWVDRNARDWQEAIVKTDRAAREEVKRVFFDGTEKNIDTYLKRVLFFHYWMSRATPLYTESIARDPVFLYNFMKMQEAMRDDSDGSGANFVKFFSTPMGYNILIRPDAFFATFASMWDDSGFEPDGESTLGKWLRHSPVMVNPLVQSALNITGFMGDTFGPDPVGANKFIQLAQAAIDNANAQFGWGLPPVGNIQESTFRQIRDFVSGQTSKILPMAEHIPYSDPMAYKQNEVRGIIADIALERGLALDSPQVQDAMVNPESDMYQEAMKRYARQDAMDIALRILPVTAVLYPKSQLASPKARTQQINREKGQGQATGVGTTQTQSDLYTERSIIAANSEEARNMLLWEDQYQSLGSPEDAAAYRFYNSIRYGDTSVPIVVGMQSYTPAQMANMPPEESEALADQWAAESGNTERVERSSNARKQFREDHPEYAEFIYWRGDVNDYPGGPEKWWQDAAEGNPNAGQYYEGLTDKQRSSDFDLTSMDAYFAYKGDKYMYYDDTPKPVNLPSPTTPYNPSDAIAEEEEASTASGSSSGATTQEDSKPTIQLIDQDITQYQADTEAYNAYASQLLGYPVVVDDLPSDTKSAVNTTLKSLGIEKPRMGDYLYAYVKWTELQGGGDTSVNSYLAWFDSQPAFGQESPYPTTVPVEETPAA